MYLDSNSAPGGGGGDKPNRIEIMTPIVGVLLIMGPSGRKAYGVGLACCAKDATDEEILGEFQAQFPGNNKVKWDSIVRTKRTEASGDEDYNRLLPRACDSDCDRVHLAVLSCVA